MNSKFRALNSVSLGAVLASAVATSPVMAQDAADTGIEEIIVTAQKREQSLQDVPIPIT